jgi:hypothetical protein
MPYIFVVEVLEEAAKERKNVAEAKGPKKNYRYTLVATKAGEISSSYTTVNRKVM